MPLAAAVATALALGATPARAEAPIEGIWSFEGGRIGIQRGPDGTFTGTVVAPTRFARCTHETGEEVWSDITEQADGSYFGLHHWFFDTDGCPPNPTPGLAAWRVLHTTDGSRFLRVCLSEPGSEQQPTIAADGTVADTTYGCFDSEPIAPLPRSTLADYVAGPRPGCLAARRLRIRFRNSKNDPLSRILIVLKGGGVRRVSRPKPRDGTFLVSVGLGGLPEAPFTVTVRMTTVLGSHLRGRRTYARCLAAGSRYPVRRPHR